MKILDGYCDYSRKKELETLMIRMANLSSYQSIVVDSSTLSSDEQKLLDKRQEDYYLFEAALLYIFSQPVYRERILSVFNNLSYRERSTFYSYYESFIETAVNHGFLSEYSLVLIKIKKYAQVWKRLVKIVAIVGFILCMHTITNSLFATLSFFIVLFYLREINSKLDEIGMRTKQTDLIVQKLNADLINSNLAWAKEKLFEYGWLNKNGKIVPFDS